VSWAVEGVTPRLANCGSFRKPDLQFSDLFSLPGVPAYKVWGVYTGLVNAIRSGSEGVYVGSSVERSMGIPARVQLHRSIIASPTNQQNTRHRFYRQVRKLGARVAFRTIASFPTCATTAKYLTPVLESFFCVYFNTVEFHASSRYAPAVLGQLIDRLRSDLDLGWGMPDYGALKLQAAYPLLQGVRVAKEKVGDIGA
jgi:hypothetical protein